MSKGPNLKTLLNTEPRRKTQIVSDTIMVTPQLMKTWHSPRYQRPLRINAKVKAVSEEIRLDGGVIPGVLTLGIWDKKEYLLDGQHRREAFYMSGLTEGYADIRRHFFDTEAEMGAEYHRLNSRLVSYRADDALRAMEMSIPGLVELRKLAPFVGYDSVRRGPYSPILSASSAVKSWIAVRHHDVPGVSLGKSSVDVAEELTVDSAKEFALFLNICLQAWGRDAEYGSLWKALNLSLCAWLYVKLVLEPPSTLRSTVLTKEEFTKGLMALSASKQYIDWLFGRNLNDNNRSPAYARAKILMSRRLHKELGKQVKLPTPSWAASLGSTRPDIIGE